MIRMYDTGSYCNRARFMFIIDKTANNNWKLYLLPKRHFTNKRTLKLIEYLSLIFCFRLERILIYYTYNEATHFFLEKETQSKLSSFGFLEC